MHALSFDVDFHDRMSKLLEKKINSPTCTCSTLWPTQQQQQQQSLEEVYFCDIFYNNL